MNLNKLLFLPGAFALLLSLTFVSCEKDNLNQSVPKNSDYDPDWGKGDSVPIVSDYYFKGKLDSQVTVIQEGIDSYSFEYDSTKYSYCNEDSTVNLMGFAARLKKPGTLANSLEIRFLFCVDDSASTEQNVSKFYKGGYPFGNDDLGERETGVIVTWIDSEGFEWQSRPGTGAQQNARFLLTEPLLEGGSSYYFEGLTDLRLYRGSSSVRIEGGEFRFKINSL